MTLQKENIEKLRALLAEGPRRIVIVSHTNPDGDAIGSSLAWAEMLEAEGHSVTCIVPNRYPYFLNWMPRIREVVIFKDRPEEATRAVAEAELLFCLDFNALSRLEILSDTIAANTSAHRILVDHHLAPAEDFEIAFSHPEASSTCFLVYALSLIHI